MSVAELENVKQRPGHQYRAPSVSLTLKRITGSSWSYLTVLPMRLAKMKIIRSRRSWTSSGFLLRDTKRRTFQS